MNTNQTVMANSAMPINCGRSDSPPTMTAKDASVSHADARSAVPAARHARKTNTKMRPTSPARKTASPGHPPSRYTQARTICAPHCWSSHGRPWAVNAKVSVRIR